MTVTDHQEPLTDHQEPVTDHRRQKKSEKSKCVSNDRAGHDDSNGPRIVKIGAILAIFEHFKVFAILRKMKNMKIMKIGARK